MNDLTLSPIAYRLSPIAYRLSPIAIIHTPYKENGNPPYALRA